MKCTVAVQIEVTELCVVVKIKIRKMIIRKMIRFSRNV